MTAITTGSIAAALTPGVRSWWGLHYDEHALQYRDLYEIVESKRAYEESFQLSSFGLTPVKAEGSSIYYDTMGQGRARRTTHVAYAMGFMITHEAMADNLYKDIAQKRTRSLAFSFKTTKEMVAANVYNRAINPATQYLGADGVPLLSNAHPTLSGNQSNIISADLSQKSLEDLVTLIGKAKNDRGLPIKLMPQSLHVPVELELQAYRILNSTLQNDTANNAVNVLRATGAFPKGIKVNNYFDDPTGYFIRTDCPESMVFFNREDHEIDQDTDKSGTKNIAYFKYSRYAPDFIDWRGVYGAKV